MHGAVNQLDNYKLKGIYADLHNFKLSGVSHLIFRQA